MRVTKYILVFFLISFLCIGKIYYMDVDKNIDGIENTEDVDTSNPVHTEYDGIALTFIIIQGVLIAGGVGGYLIYKKKKEQKIKEQEKQNISSNNNQLVFYSSYDNVKKVAPQSEVKNETTSVFTSTSTFSTSSIVNGPNQNNNSN